MSLVQTHPNFASKVPSIKSAADIEIFMQNANIHPQHHFKRTTTQLEMIRYWTINNLENVNINLEKIDRLYDISIDKSHEGSELNLVARMIYENEKFLYVKLNSSEDMSNTIFVSFDLVSFLDRCDISRLKTKMILNDAQNERQTRLNFVSMVPNIESIDVIQDQITQFFLNYPCKFERNSSVWELDYKWNPGELEKVFIDVEKIDRLYSFFLSGSSLQFRFRLNVDGKHFYIVLHSQNDTGKIVIHKNLLP